MNIQFSFLLKRASGAVAAALLVVGVAVAASTLTFPLTATKLDLEGGRVTFEARCAGCHAVEPGQPSKLGPSLAVIGETGAHRVPELSAPEYILQSIIEPAAYIEVGMEGRMPAATAAGLEANKLRDLIAWLSTRGTAPDYKAVLELNVLQQLDSGPSAEAVDVPSVQRGWELFASELGCSGCHRVFGAPGSEHLAPTLEGVSLMSEEYLLEAWRDPSAYIHPDYVYTNVELTDGSFVSGRELSSTVDQTILIVLDNDSGARKRRVLPAAQIVNATRESRSRMPPYSLSPEDERSLLDFLRFLSAGV